MAGTASLDPDVEMVNVCSRIGRCNVNARNLCLNAFMAYLVVDFMTLYAEMVAVYMIG